MGFVLGNSMYRPCSQASFTLLPGPHDGRRIPITVSLVNPPSGITAAPIQTNSDADGAQFVVDIANLDGNYQLTAVAESPGYPSVEVPLFVFVTCWPDVNCATCLTPSGTACTTDADCTMADSPICDPSFHVCRLCYENTECAPHGDGRALCQRLSGGDIYDSGQCVECLTSSDCIGRRKTCDTMVGTCAQCTANEQCASGQCDVASGECADPSTLVYVGRSTYGQSCTGPGSGTLTDPFCTLSDGLAYGASVGKTVVVWTNNYEEKIVIAPAAGQSYRVSAVGVGVGQPEIASPGGTVVVDVRLGNAQLVDVSLENFYIRLGTDGVSCQGGATPSAAKISVKRSNVSSNHIGVHTVGCDVTLDRDTIEDNNSGVLLESSDFTLTNLLVADNGAPGYDASLYGGITATGTSARASLTSSTIVFNRLKSGATNSAGVACVPGMTFVDNVVVGNQGGAPEVDIATCAPQYSSFVGAGSANGNQDLTNCGADATAIESALFVSAFNYRPKSGGLAPCTLVGLGTAAGAPTVTIDGKLRPAPPSIGCYEP
ncbi:MAG: hypothetical protein JWN44_4218 [Myxococcales bacterium]|nr:hypothetical protein [Myxococcales bacterium]